MRELDPISPDVIESKRISKWNPPAYTEFEVAQPVIPASHYFWVVYKHKWKIFAFVVACVLATYLYSSRLPRIYEATATIDVDRQLPSSVIGGGQTISDNDADAFLATQSELIQSDAVLRPVVRQFNLLDREAALAKVPPDKRPHLTDAPVFLSQLRIGRPPGTYLIKISYRSADPVLASDVANAIAASFLRHSFEIRMSSSAALSSFMEKQLDELKAKMERSSMALAKFEQELNIINPEQRTSIVSARLLQLNTEYTTAQADRVSKEAIYNAVKSGSLAAAQVSSQSEELNRLTDRLNQAKQHLASVGTVYGPGYAEYRKAAKDVAELQGQFDETRKNVEQRVETDYNQAVAREQMLGQAVAETKSEFDELNSRSFEYQRLKRDADADKALYSDLERQIKETAINSNFQGNSVRVADVARPSQFPVLPKTKMDVLLAFVISLVLALCAAVLSDVVDTTVRDPEMASRLLGTSVIGALPRVKDMRRISGPVRPALLPPDAPDTVPPFVRNASGRQKAYEGLGSYEEAIRTLRHSILLPDADQNMRSLLVTSAVPGEGKSTAIIHLAVAHAEQGRRTLIIDADLRRPTIHKRLEIDGSRGLSNVLLGEAPWKDVIVPSNVLSNLDVLPAGMASRRASDLVGAMMIDILDDAANDYDLILVDAPPLLGFAEALQIATSVDGVVVLAKAGQTSRKAIASVLATLRRLRAHTVGLVLNEVDRNNSHGYYYYADYRKYYSEKEA